MISYGIYLVHWPVFVIVDADRTGLDGPTLTVVRFLITAVIAIASYFLLERPIRSRQATPCVSRPAQLRLASLAVIAVAIVDRPRRTGQLLAGRDRRARGRYPSRSTPDPVALTVAPTSSTTTPTRRQVP